MKMIQKIMICIVAAILLYCVFISNIYLQLLASGQKDLAFKFNPDAYESLLQKSNLASSLPQRETLARQAYKKSPSDARPLLDLANLYVTQGDIEHAKLMIQYADKLQPRDAVTQLMIADFWEQQGNVQQALSHLSTALEMQAKFRAKVFPNLLALAQDKKNRSLLADLMKQPPIWWHEFFVYSIHQRASLETMHFLFSAHDKLPPKLAKEQRKIYVDLLINGRVWKQAYLAWVNALSQNEVAALGYIFNGKFELPISQAGFDWRVNDDPRHHIAIDSVTDQTDGNVLSVSFNGSKPISNRLIGQLLMLDAGEYHLQGVFKSNDLLAGNGLKWSIICVDGAVLARTPLISGNHPWSRFDVDFQVPERECQAQQITLDIDPGSYAKLDYSGQILFDSILINKY